MDVQSIVSIVFCLKETILLIIVPLIVFVQLRMRKRGSAWQSKLFLVRNFSLLTIFNRIRAAYVGLIASDDES
jgi:hypothetical protein